MRIRMTMRIRIRIRIIIFVGREKTISAKILFKHGFLHVL
jgi:hypothetical protein